MIAQMIVLPIPLPILVLSQRQGAQLSTRFNPCRPLAASFVRAPGWTLAGGFGIQNRHVAHLPVPALPV
jgi:hypothetical protein